VGIFFRRLGDERKGALYLCVCVVYKRVLRACIESGLVTVSRKTLVYTFRWSFWREVEA
jgi:hypothetical protein